MQTPKEMICGGTKLRILALHSFRTSASIFRQQFRRAKLDLQLEDLVELVFVNAPHAASGAIPRDVAPYFTAPFYEWFTVESMGDKFEFDEEKLAQSTQYVERVVREQGPFDGIVGFSQGAVLASSLVAMQHRGVILTDVPPLRFCILFAGFKSRHPQHQACMQSKLPVPSVQVFGDKDQLKEHCIQLADAFEDSIVLMHARGHVVPPLNKQQLAVMRAFLKTFLPSSEELSTPTLVPTSSTTTSRL